MDASPKFMNPRSTKVVKKRKRTLAIKARNASQSAQAITLTHAKGSMIYLVENCIHIPLSTASNVLQAPPSAWHLTLCNHMVQFSRQIGHAAEWQWCNTCLLAMHEQIHRGTRTVLPPELLSSASKWQREKGILVRKDTRPVIAVSTTSVISKRKKIKVVVQQFEPPLIIREGNVSVK